jgi:hypothetical protein
MHLYLKYQSPTTFGSKDIAQFYQKRDLFIMHLYLKYQSPITFGSKDIAQFKVFQD